MLQEIANQILTHHNNRKLEIVFYETLCPNHLLVHKDSTLFKDKGHILFEAYIYSTHHPLKADQNIPITSFQ